MGNRGIIAIVCVALGLFLIVSALPVRATMTLEASTTWKDYGNTRVHGVFVGDVGGTSAPEVVTAGEAVDGAAGVVKAQLRVYEHSGSALTLKNSELWTHQSDDVTVWLGVYAADVDGSAGIEIITVGYAQDGSDPTPVAKIWTYSGGALSAGDDWTVNEVGTFRSVHAKDVTGGSTREILIAGDVYNNSTWHYEGYLLLFTYDGQALTNVDYVKWASANNDVVAYSVHSEDIDTGDANVEIVTAGAYGAGADNEGEVRVWHYSGTDFVLEDDDRWQLNRDENTVFYGVYNANVDNSGDPEIVACGFRRDGTANENWGLLRIYRHSGSTTTGQQYVSWDSGSETVCRSVHAADLDTGDAQLEISAGGWALISNTYNGEIKTFQWNGGSGDSITLEDTTQWYTTGNTKVNSVYDADADGFADIEVVSGGYANDGTDDRGELRVWHL